MLRLGLSYFVIMVVLDASTLILIAKAGLLDLFLAHVGVPVAIPVEVERESGGSKKALDALITQKVLDESRMKTLAVRNRRLVTRLESDVSLGKGEAEAITLALGEKVQLPGIDDKNGINVCKLLGRLRNLERAW